MSKFCALANAYTNCTDNCDSCLAEETQQNDLLNDLRLEQQEQK